jgi:hypothetical protein
MLLLYFFMTEYPNDLSTHEVPFELNQELNQQQQAEKVIEEKSEKESHNEVAAIDYVETEELKKIQRAVQQTAHQRWNMFDMFADEDDETKFIDCRMSTLVTTQVAIVPYTPALADNWDDSEGYYRKFISVSAMSWMMRLFI